MKGANGYEIGGVELEKCMSDVLKKLKNLSQIDRRNMVSNGYMSVNKYKYETKDVVDVIYNNRAKAYVVKDESIRMYSLSDDHLLNFKNILRDHMYKYLRGEDDQDKEFRKCIWRYLEELDINDVSNYSYVYQASERRQQDDRELGSIIRTIFVNYGVVLAIGATEQGVLYPMNPLTRLFNDLARLTQQGNWLIRDEYEGVLSSLSMMDRIKIGSYLARGYQFLARDNHNMLRDVANGIPSIFSAYVDVTPVDMESIILQIRYLLIKDSFISSYSQVELAVEVSTESLAPCEDIESSIQSKTYSLAPVAIRLYNPEIEVQESKKDSEDPVWTPVGAQAPVVDLIQLRLVSKRMSRVVDTLLKYGQYKVRLFGDGFPFSKVYFAQSYWDGKVFIPQKLFNVCSQVVEDITGSNLDLVTSVSVMDIVAYPQLLALTVIISLKAVVVGKMFLRGLALLDMVYEEHKRDVEIGMKLLQKYSTRYTVNAIVSNRVVGVRHSKIYSYLITQSTYYKDWYSKIRHYGLIRQ